MNDGEEISEYRSIYLSKPVVERGCMKAKNVSFSLAGYEVSGNLVTLMPAELLSALDLREGWMTTSDAANIHPALDYTHLRMSYPEINSMMERGCRIFSHSGGDAVVSRRGMTLALLGALMLLSRHMPALDCKNLEPVTTLLTNLMDLDNGIVPPALRPSPTQGKHIDIQSVIDFKARCLVLSKIMRKEVGWTKSEADKAVVRKVGRSAAALGVKIEDQSLESWRRSLRSRPKRDEGRLKAGDTLASKVEFLEAHVKKFAPLMSVEALIEMLMKPLGRGSSLDDRKPQSSLSG
jgi:hypothetical protein